MLKMKVMIGAIVAVVACSGKGADGLMLGEGRSLQLQCPPKTRKGAVTSVPGEAMYWRAEDGNGGTTLYVMPQRRAYLSDGTLVPSGEWTPLSKEQEGPQQCRPLSGRPSAMWHPVNQVLRGTVPLPGESVTGDESVTGSGRG